MSKIKENLINGFSTATDLEDIIWLIQKTLKPHHIEHLLNEGFSIPDIYSMIIDHGVKSVGKQQAHELGFTFEGKSSSGLLFPNEIKFDDKAFPKYCQKAGSNVQAYFIDNCKVITEGFKDAFSGTVHGKIPTGTISGVQSFEKVLAPDSGYTLIFDSDGWTNPKVMIALLRAGKKVNGKINLVPHILGEPKAGLCEFFKAGYTDKDYFELVNNAYKPDEFLNVWINETINLIKDTSNIHFALKHIAIYCLEHFNATGVKLTINSLCKAFKGVLLRKDIKDFFDERQAEIDKENVKKLKEEFKVINADNNAILTSVYTEKGYQELYKDDYISIEGELYKWEKTHYKLADLSSEANRISNWLLSEATESGKEKFASSYIENVYKWAVTRCNVAKEKVNPMGLNLLNGYLKISWDKDNKGTVKLLPHDKKNKEFVFTYCAETNYDPEADQDDCLKLLSCLDEVERNILLRVIASALDFQFIKSTTGRPRALLLSGTGNNGKDTIRSVVEILFNESVCHLSLNHFKLYDEGNQFHLSKLDKSLISWSSESKQINIEELQSLKAAISGDPLEKEKKGKDSVTFTPNTVFFFNCNKPPAFTSNMEAIASRWAVVGFNKTYSMKPDLLKGELQADPRFKDDPNFLKEKVAPAFLNLLIKQLEDIAINGIDYNPLQENLEKIKRDSSHLFQFCNDVGIEEDSNGKIYINDLWELLRNWYIDQGILELEISDKGKEKLIFHDSANKYDRHVKSNNQIRARFTEIFPKLKWGKNMVRGENYNRAYLGGIVQTALTDLTPTNTIDTALTDDLTVKGSVKAVSITESHVKAVKAIITTSVRKYFKIFF
jgi:phage/plasmid-associated DNA primase